MGVGEIDVVKFVELVACTVGVWAGFYSFVDELENLGIFVLRPFGVEPDGVGGPKV